MADLLKTLTGDSFTEDLSGVELTQFQVFKQERKVHIFSMLSSETYSFRFNRVKIFPDKWHSLMECLGKYGAFVIDPPES